MTLDAAARSRFTRQLLVGEIGESGQERLLEARFRPAEGCDADAYAVAADYLERAGCSFDPNGEEVRVAAAEDVARLAGTPALHEAAARVAGAFAAVEHLKEILGIDAARDLPPDLRLSDEV